MKAFAGLFIAFFLISTIIYFENIVQENQLVLSESKQRLIEYQKTEQKRVELMNSFEKAANAGAMIASAAVAKGATSLEAKEIFCSTITVFIDMITCSHKFNFDTKTLRAVLKEQLQVAEENYKITFQEGGYFSAVS